MIKIRNLNNRNISNFVLRASDLTTRPGVYLYYDAAGTVIYVGKAKNLRLRVRQYFAAGSSLSPKTRLLVSQISRISTLATDCEFDAIILESVLIRKYLPKYNAIARDDKSPLYLAITLDETLPRLFSVRKTTINSWNPMPRRRFIAGPFQSGYTLRRLMQSIRRIIPYCSQKTRDGNPCFYTHIGLCRDCPSLIHGMSAGPRRAAMTARYRSNIRRIALILSGQGSRVRADLTRSMLACARSLAFEQAGQYKKQLDVLNRLLTREFDPAVYTQGLQEPGSIYETRLTDLLAALKGAGMKLRSLSRIECIDISNIQGTWATGSLVVFTGGIPDTREYRRFRIRLPERPNDAKMIAEVTVRRFSHREWALPDLFIVDGGKPQLGAAIQAVQAMKEIPVIGLAKRFEEIVVPVSDSRNRRYAVIRLPAASPALQILQHIRDEAHRFAKRYHTMIRSIKA